MSRAALIIVLGLFAAVAPLRAQPIDNQPKVHASLIAESPSVAPGGQVTVALQEIIRERWHTYWRNPGDSGEPTTITWHLPPGWKASGIEWPYPKRLPVGPLMDFGYENEVALLSTVSTPADAKPGDIAHIKAHVMWLVCAEVCIPEETDLALDLKIDATAPTADAATAEFFAKARARLPNASPWPASYSADADTFILKVQSAGLAKANPRDVFFYPNRDGAIANPAPQKFETSKNGITLTTKSGWKLASADAHAKAGPLDGVLVLTNADGSDEALEISAKPVPAGLVGADLGFGVALLFAFLGGLILNLMPCVLPVLSIKALALARAKPETAHREALAYGVGVVLSFAALGGLLIALRAGGEAVGWGFQLQEPFVVAAFALLIFAVGLNFSGVFEFGEHFAGVGHKLTRHGGWIGSFFTGVLAVAVAAPCTAPFMGAAMGFALTQPAALALGVFIALSLGFAAPFVAIGFTPQLKRLIPKPGSWMATLRQALAFPMYATAIWLAWVLSLEAGLDGVVALLGAALALAFALWAYGATQITGRGRVLAWMAVVLGLAGMFALLTMIHSGKPATTQMLGVLPSEPYSAAKLASLRAEGRPVFVNATAAWCITCLVNERVALSQDSVRDIFARKNVAYLVADWTRRDAEVTNLLTAHGRTGVPLYLYFPPRGEAVVMPQILTESAIRSTFENANDASKETEP